MCLIRRGGQITNIIFRGNRYGSCEKIWGISGSFMRGGGLLQVTCAGCFNVPLYCRYLRTSQNCYLTMIVVGGFIIKTHRYVQFRILFICQDNNFLIIQRWPSRCNQFFAHSADVNIKAIFGGLIPSDSSIIKYIFSNIISNIPFSISWGVR